MRPNAGQHHPLGGKCAEDRRRLYAVEGGGFVPGGQREYASSSVDAPDGVIATDTM